VLVELDRDGLGIAYCRSEGAAITVVTRYKIED
jgi:hypothetical protein